MIEPTTETQTKEIRRIIRRHKARLLQNLEDDECPVGFFNEVKGKIDWMKSDIMDFCEGRTEAYNNEQRDNTARLPM